ncbi:MAG: orotate phosphoribosyltransferase [Bacteroidales bacterium]
MRKKNVAKQLLQINAIKLEPAKPFLWSSGWHSPIYCDNRLVLSFPETRNLIKESFCELISELYPSVTLIAGVATGAVAHGALVADRLNLPFAYVRPKPKEHGLANMIEGKVTAGDRVVVIEDLVSTGKSSLMAVESLRSAGCDIMGMVAIFTYGFDIAAANFRDHSCELHTLTDYSTLIEEARDAGAISEQHTATLREWRDDPAGWKI